MTSGGRFADAAFGRKLLVAAIACVAVVAGVAIGLSANKAIWEGWVTDRLFQVRANLRGMHDEARAPVAVIGLDWTALNSEKLLPIPRVLMTPVLAEAGQAVLDAGALALGYDFVFAYSAEAFRDPKSGEARLTGFDQPFLGFLYRNRGQVFIAHTEIGVPHRSFSAAVGAGGVRTVTVDSDNDGVVRRHAPQPPLIDSPSMVDALLAKAGYAGQEEYVAIPSTRLATSMPYLSLLDVLKMKSSEAGQVELRRFVEGRIVLFGGLLPYEDEHLYSDRFLPQLPADMSETGSSGRPPVRTHTAGVYMLADFIASALSGRIAVTPPKGVVPALAVLFAVTGVLLGLILPSVVLPFVAVVGAAAALGISLVGLDYGLMFAPGVAPVAFISSMVFAAAGKVLILQRRQRALVRLFGHYLAPDVIKQMAQSEQLPELGGDTRNVVVAFIDIVGFTKMSEKLADRDVVRVVNSSFDAIGEVITAHKGYIDKYIGDAIMAVWNAPNTVERPEQAAVDASRQIIAMLDHLRAITGQSPLDLRVALNSGPALVGDIGGEHRRSFTVMGTTVNTASRIESVAKEKKVRLAISQSVADGLPKSYPVKEIWTGKLRGLSTDISVFTLDVAEMYMENTDQMVTGKAKRRPRKLLNFPR